MRYLNDLKREVPAYDDHNYLLTRLALRKALETVEDGLQWLSLVESGHSGWSAARMLKHSDDWLNNIKELCKIALYEEETLVRTEGGETDESQSATN